MAVRVLVVDDSATARALIKEILSKSQDIEVVGTAPDPYIARDKIVELKPDVICLDVEMPKMDGITFLKKLMIHFPTPVVMISSLTKKGAKTTLDALEAGAIDFVTKPSENIYKNISDIEDEIIQKVITASKSKVINVNLKKSNREVLEVSSNKDTLEQKIIALGASTGGTEALKDILIKLPITTPGIVIVQHMPESFTGAFAKRLNDLCQIDVKEAKDGDKITMGRALIAPGGMHMVVRKSNGGFFVEIGGGEKVSGHKPSVDVLFNSIAKNCAKSSICVILTGMGSDGAKGILNVKNCGGITIAQDENSCVVFGMPKVAIELGAIDYVENIENIAKKILSNV